MGLDPDRLSSGPERNRRVVKMRAVITRNKSVKRTISPLLAEAEPECQINLVLNRQIG